VLARLKRDPETADIPVVIVSVIDNPELGIALGALDYFVKPVEATALVRCVSRYNFRRRTGQDDCRVLVVDDESSNRDLLRQILEPAGFQVTLAGGGHEALQLAASAPPDLVLLDLLMPEVSGFDVVERLRSRPATRAIPIIILTAKDLTEDDKAQLNGRVSRILARRSTGAADLLSQLQEVIVHRAVPA
jgi:CheY-like chemotaxis protein